MPKVIEMLESKFLRQQDVGAGMLLTVAGCEQRNVAKQGADPELKWCLLFSEEEKPLVLNSTNIQLCVQIFGADDSDLWIGKQLVLYTDPTIMFAGKVVGGIRVRKPKGRAAKAPPPPPEPPERQPGDEDDDSPF